MQPIEIDVLKIVVHAKDQSIAGLVEKTLVLAGCEDIEVFQQLEDTESSIHNALPRVVIILANPNDDDEWEEAVAINRKRAANKKRTPKILGLVKPTSTDLKKARAAGFYDILPLPQSPASVSNRIRTIISRLD